METLAPLSQADLQNLVAVATRIPPTTNWEFLKTTLQDVLATNAPGVDAALWLPSPDGLVPLTPGAESVFAAFISDHEVEDYAKEPGEFTMIPPGYRQAIVANRQTFGQLLIAGDRSREDFLRHLSGVIATPAGLSALAVQLGDEVSKRTSTDKLTGLWNRQYFNERFREECERLVRSKETGAVAIVSLDNFSALARTMAPEEQNALFAQVGQAVRQVIRQTDWGVRWDNFDLLFYFPSTSAEAAVEVLKRFTRKMVSTSPILEPISGVSSTVETTSPRALIQLATRRLDLARKDGNRRVICFATPGGGLQFYREETEA
ncbi:GGDEF domain-containing protein [bacterium]|nr:GGDEF domain-containing protein [bacterium]